MFDPFFGLLSLAAIIIPLAAFIYWGNPKRRLVGKVGCFVPLGCALAAIAAFLFYAGPELFVSNEGATEIYVIPHQQKAERFTEELAGLAKRYGMTPHLSQSPETDGLTNHIIEASGYRLNLWSMNMPLDTRENPNECGRYSEFVHSDPGQYIVRVSRILPLGTKVAVQELISKISAGLKAEGYEVRSKPVACSPLSKLRAPH